MSNKYTKVSAEAFKNIQLETGVLLNSFDPSNPGTVADSNIVCATTGGIKPSIVPNYEDYGADIDNCPENTMELKRLRDFTCKLAFTSVEATPEVIRLGIGAATVDGGHVTPAAELSNTHFKDIWWVGDKADGGFAAICLKNALSTGGLTVNATKNGKGKFDIELTGHYSLTDITAVPMDFYVIDAGAGE